MAAINHRLNSRRRLPGGHAIEITISVGIEIHNLLSCAVLGLNQELTYTNNIGEWADGNTLNV